jgi:hypothetical protein
VSACGDKLAGSTGDLTSGSALPAIVAHQPLQRRRYFLRALSSPLGRLGEEPLHQFLYRRRNRDERRQRGRRDVKVSRGR